MKSIIEVHQSYNNVSIKLNLEPNQVVQLWDAFTTLADRAREQVEYNERNSVAARQARMKERRMEDLRIHRRMRTATEERLDSVIHILARETGSTSASVVTRAKIVERHIKRRYQRIRNASIRRMVADGFSYTEISKRYGLSRARLSQIIKEEKCAPAVAVEFSEGASVNELISKYRLSRSAVFRIVTKGATIQ